MLGDIRFNEAMWNIRRKIFYSHLTRNSYHFRSSIVTPHVATLDATLIHATNIYRLRVYRDYEEFLLFSPRRPVVAYYFPANSRSPQKKH